MNEFKDHVVQNPDKFIVTDNPDGTKTIKPFWVENPTDILQAGTPFNAAAFNAIPAELAAIDQKVTSQLADKAQEVIEVNQQLLPVGKNKAMISFIDDDNRVEFMSKLKPILDAKGIKCAIAVMTGSVGNANTNSLSTLKQLQNEGFEIVSHGVTGLYIKNATDEVAIQECRDSRDWLLANGFKGYKYHVYSGGCPVDDYRTHRISRQFYKASFATNALRNQAPISQGCINRYDFMTRSLATSKGLIDSAIAENSWIIFYTHSWMPEFDSVKQDEFSQLIDHAQAGAIDIVTLEEGLERMGNVVETLDETGERTVISKTGVASLDLVEDTTKFLGLVDNLNTKLGTDYLKDVISVEYASIYATNLPIASTSGQLLTVRADDDYYIVQMFIANADGIIYQRHWKTTTASWGAWNRITRNTMFKTGSGFDQAITAYPADVVTINNYPNGSQTATAPVASVGGVLTTYRFASDDTYSYQTYKAYNGTQIYVRNWSKSGSAWGAWAAT